MRASLWLIALTASLSIPGCSSDNASKSRVAAVEQSIALPTENFSRKPLRQHKVGDTIFQFDQLEYFYRVPGEFTHRMTGSEYGFQSLSIFITETHPCGGPGLHVHDTEEAHVLLEGSVRYQIGDGAMTVQAPYVARVPAGVPHTFVNVGTKPFNLIAMFASKEPTTTRIGPNPLISYCHELSSVR